MEEPRGIRKEELDPLMEEIRPGNPSDLSNRWPLLFNPENAENIRVIKEGNKVISRAGIEISDMFFWGYTLKVGGVGHVSTREEYRGKGYASRLMLDCMRRIKEQDCDFMHISGGRGLYERLGCRRAGKVHYCCLTKENAISIDAVEIRPFLDSHSEFLAEMYEVEPVRFNRRFSDFCKALRNPFSGQIFTIFEAGIPAGYVVIACDDFIAIPLHQQMPARGQILEYAGSRRAILKAVSTLLTNLDLKEIYLYIPSHDKEFVNLLDERKLPYTSSYSPMGTYKILDFPGLIKSLRPHFECRLSGKQIDSLDVDQMNGDPRKNDSYSIRFEGEEFITKQIEHLVFGYGEEQTPYIQNEKLRNILKRIFPIPLIWHGLNSV